MVAKAFGEIMPGEEVKRGFQTRGGGKEEADVVMPFFHIECKHQAAPNIRAALRQAIDDSIGNDRVPVVVTKRNREKPIVSMQLDDFLGLIKEWYDGLPYDKDS